VESAAGGVLQRLLDQRLGLVRPGPTLSVTCRGLTRVYVLRVGSVAWGVGGAVRLWGTATGSARRVAPRRGAARRVVGRSPRATGSAARAGTS